jgi:hypothetical protein
MKERDLIERIAAADSDRAAILRSFPTEVLPVSTPFYKAIRVVDIDVATHLGKLRFRYGLEGERTVALGERPEAVYALNERDGLRLVPDAARAYVRFFFDSVGGRKMTVVESAAEIPWCPRRPEDTRPAPTRPVVKPIAVEPLPGGGYRAVASATWDVMLIEVTVEVSPGGRILPTSQRLLMNQLEIMPA